MNLSGDVGTISSSPLRAILLITQTPENQHKIVSMLDSLRASQALFEKKHTEQDGDDWIHKRVSRDLGDGDVLQQIREAAETDERSEDAQVDDGEDAVARPASGVQRST